MKNRFTAAGKSETGKRRNGEAEILRLAGSPIPRFSFRRKIWNKWKQFSLWLGSMMGRLWLTLFYFTLIVPFVIIVRLTGNSFARHATPEWQPVASPDDPQTAAKKQG